MQVRAGSPGQSASQAVLGALWGKVSRDRLASCRLGSAANGANKSLSAFNPLISASCLRLRIAAGGNSGSHRTLSSTAVRSRVQTSNISGMILKLLLKEQKTKPF